MSCLRVEKFPFATFFSVACDKERQMEIYTFYEFNIFRISSMPALAPISVLRCERVKLVKIYDVFFHSAPSCRRMKGNFPGKHEENPEDENFILI